MEIVGQSATHLYYEVLGWAKVAPHSEERSRLGTVRVLDDPLTICNLNPRQRVLVGRQRNANPFFHMMEAIWMFAGAENDWITKFNSNMREYLEPSTNQFHGAYGFRWRRHFDMDQVETIIKMLEQGDRTRRAYLAIWDPCTDLDSRALDLPCNVGMAFRVQEDKLNGYVYNRSNDLIWGMLGTNIVQFSMLLEVIASCTGYRLGKLYQITCNPHIYERHWPLFQDAINWEGDNAPTISLNVDSWDLWTKDAEKFLEEDVSGNYYHYWFTQVAIPMYRVYVFRDHSALKYIAATDWREAAEDWIKENRHEG
jgi:thymidylate synthase